MADELNAAEQAEYEKFMTTDQTIPPLDEQEGAPAAPAAPAPAPSAAPAPSPAASPTPAAPPASDPAAPAASGAETEEERFSAWRAQHADKTPEQLAQLAFQQTQRASGAEARARTATQSLQQINDRVRAASEAATTARQAIKDRAARFDQQLQDDPDGASRALREERDAAELAAIDQAEFSARQDAAIGLASQALPDFQERAPAVYAFGGEMGYSQQELAGISDGRDLVVLAMADMAARLIKGGLMDMSGNLVAAPAAVATTDPRLTAPTPVPTLSSTPARPASSGKQPGQQAVDVLNMSDADFAKLPPAELEALTRQLEG